MPIAKGFAQNAAKILMKAIAAVKVLRETVQAGAQIAAAAMEQQGIMKFRANRAGQSC